MRSANGNKAPAPRRSRRTTTRSPGSKPRSEETITRKSRTARKCPTVRLKPEAANPRYHFVGGKGGVGKTTCAAGIALAAAAAGQRILLVSTDPAPSLADALGRPLASAPRAVPLRRGSLDAVEIDARRALAKWLATRRAALERIALRGTWLDRDDVARLLRLSLPGIDEVAALFEVSRLAGRKSYDLIVVDTAPTGHTLRMLTMPATLRGMARVFDHMQAKHRVMVEALRGGWAPDAEDQLIGEIDADGRELAELLRDPARTRLSWVTLPEAMAIEETADAAAVLRAEGIPLHDIIVNRITPQADRRCSWCDARRGLEQRAIGILRVRLPAVRLTAVGWRDAEPRGLRPLAGIGAEVAADVTPRGPERAPVQKWRAAMPRAPRANVPQILGGADTRLVLFGGKGGVGKTTCAAAAAIALAAGAPRRRVLLLSTDPAHSLGDVFGAGVSDVPSAIKGAPVNLQVREIDAAAGFRLVRERYAGAIEALFDRVSQGGSSGIGLDARHDRVVMHDLIELAPPGIDELAAVIDVTDALDRSGRPDTNGGYDVIVMDTAPSGHALRLLEMPALVQDWTRALMSILLKYQAVTGIGELGAMLLRLSQGLGRLRTLLTDPGRASFVVVTRAAALPRQETVRLIRSLRRMRVHVPTVVINAAGRGTCARCRRADAAADRELSSLRHAAGLRGLRIAVTPAEIPPPHGAASLRRWQRTWIELTSLA
ncbi:MAG: ArsA family ATPase [Acidobacteriota bacterium]